MFLRNGNGKVLKSCDGRCFGIYVTNPPVDQAVDHYKNRKISFSCTEIFDVDDEEALYNVGISSVPQQYWNR